MKLSTQHISVLLLSRWEQIRRPGYHARSFPKVLLGIGQIRRIRQSKELSICNCEEQSKGSLEKEISNIDGRYIKSWFK